MKKLNQMNLDVYLYIKEYMKEKGFCPTYREILDNTNYKSLASVKETVEKLTELKFLKVSRNENGIILARTIKVIDDKNTREQIEELRNGYNTK